MNRIYLSIILLSFLARNESIGQTKQTFINEGFIDEEFELPIDAINFVNQGSVSIYGDHVDYYFLPLERIDSPPFTTLNTLNYTNFGVMNGFPGFVFENIDNNGLRKPASSFFNGVGAEVRAGSDFSPTRIEINATNIQHHGLLSVGASGILELKGDNVNLSGGALGIEPITGIGSSVFGTNFMNDAGISDMYWGGFTNQLNVAGFINMIGDAANLTAPFHEVTNQNGFVAMTSMALQSANSYIYTNAVTETNIVVQGVFAALGDPKITTAARFAPSTETNEINTAILELRVPLTNVVTGSSDVFSLYLQDTSAWQVPPHDVDQNQPSMLYNPMSGTFMPYNYLLSRQAFATEWANGVSGNAELTPDLYYNDTYTNNVVTNLYTAYSADVNTSESLFLETPVIPLEESAPGRIRVQSKSLDMSNLRVRGEGVVSIETDHLIQSKGAVLDSVNANFTLASTNSVLDIDNIIEPTVNRFSGNLRAYSAVWTNLSGLIVTNPPADENSEETYSTNVITILFHALLVDATGLNTSTEVLTHRLKAKGENVRIATDFDVVRELEVNSPNVTVESELALFGRVRNLGHTNFLNLVNFTNLGGISVNEVAKLGFQPHEKIDNFINEGSISAFSPRFKSKYFENSNEGVISGGGRVEINAETANYGNGVISSGRDMVIEGTNIKMRDANFDTGGTFIIGVDGILTDGGFSNTMITRNGFRMTVKPKQGDLLGSSITSQIPRFATASHVWLSQDLGNNSAGYKNNQSVGTLILNGANGTRARFSGPSAGNSALYVDYLSLQGHFEESWSETILIDPNFTLYFADSNVSPESLHNKVGGRLQWVPSYAGPRSGVAVVVDGAEILINRARLQSLILDDDGDGIANGIDDVPFDDNVFTQIDLEYLDETYASISWMAAGNSNYKVEYTDDLISGSWQYLKGVQNNRVDPQIISVNDLIQSGGKRRFYRVIFSQ